MDDKNKQNISIRSKVRLYEDPLSPNCFTLVGFKGSSFLDHASLNPLQPSDEPHAPSVPISRSYTVEQDYCSICGKILDINEAMDTLSDFCRHVRITRTK